jgi:phage gpG-like protein
MIEGYLIGDKEVIARLEAMPKKVHDSLLRRITRLAASLTHHVKADKLTNQVLHVRSGNLRTSIHQSITDAAAGIVAKVGTNVEYAAKHEYGFHGAEAVKAHLRTITQAFGRPISPREVLVRAHTRQVTYPERSFLRSALADMSDKIKTEMKEGLSEGVRK